MTVFNVPPEPVPPPPPTLPPVQPPVPAPKPVPDDPLQTRFVRAVEGQAVAAGTQANAQVVMASTGQAHVTEVARMAAAVDRSAAALIEMAQPTPKGLPPEWEVWLGYHQVLLGHGAAVQHADDLADEALASFRQRFVGVQV